ncbi:MAG: ABC transporter substrate-binding protein, partial [Zoogloea sp.]|nr:ABC transporter substrate-binding protein [Zoogloea sp.]
GFNRVAKYYYYPGWWEGGPQLSLYVNAKAWASLPKEYQIILEDACLYAHAQMQATYDAKNPVALKQLIGQGTQLRPFPNEIMAAGYKIATELYEETAALNPRFKKIYDAWKKFREDQVQWFAVAENRYDNFMQAARIAKGRK